MTVPLVGLDARRAAWMGQTGIGRYAATLLAGAVNDERVRLRPLVAAGQRLAAGTPAITIQPALGRTQRLVWEQVSLPLAARRHRLDLVHLPWYEGAPHLPVPFVLTIQDLHTLHHPADYPRAFRMYYNRLLRPLARRARLVIVPSQATARDLAEQGVTTRALRVVPYGHDPDLYGVRSVSEVAPGDTGMVLYCGGYGPRKNVERLIEAFARVHREHPHASLVLCGDPEPSIRELIVSWRLQDSVQLPGRVSEAELRSLYARADAACYPSHFEGFGFPVLEALAAGVPLVASNSSSIPEIAAGCGTLFDPRSTEELASGLLRALRVGPDVLAEVRAGLDRARAFTWENCCRRHVDCYLEALS